MNTLDFSCLGIDTTNGKPRVLVVGKEQDSFLRQFLFDNNTKRISPRIETYGFGNISERYNNWIPGHDEKFSFARDTFMNDPVNKSEPYKFDLCVLHLDNWKNYLDTKTLTSTVPDPYTLMTWCLDRLAIGAPIIITGQDMFFTEIIGSLSYRLSTVHCMRQGQSSNVAVIGCKKVKAVRNDAEKKQVSAFFAKLKERDWGYMSNTYYAFSYLPPAKSTYTISRAKVEDPIIFSRLHNPNYIARSMAKASMSHPFEPLRERYALSSKERRVRLPMEPPLGQIAKLATLADGPILNEQGEIVVIKGTAETVSIYDAKTKETRQLKRQTMITIQMTGPELSTVTDPAKEGYVGRINRFVLG